MELTESVVMSHNPLYHSSANWICRIMVSPIYKRIEVRIDIRPSCSLLVMMHFFSWLHKCDLKIQLHRRDLYQSLAVCGRHVFTMRCLLEKIKLWHFMENKLPYAHLRYIFYIFHCSTALCGGVWFRWNHLVHHSAPNAARQSCSAAAPPGSRGIIGIRCTPTESESCLHLQRDIVVRIGKRIIYMGSTLLIEINHDSGVAQ